MQSEVTNPAARTQECEGAWAATGSPTGGAALPVIYIACSPFSGSTLLALLLNAHPEITTSGHSTGWEGLTETFPCSCGREVQHCPFFQTIENEFQRHGTSLGFRGHFPTRYTLALGLPRLDQIAFENLPLLGSTKLEMLRDRIVRGAPGLGRRVSTIDRANVRFFRSATSYAGASVYVDNSHSPYRFTRLQAIPELALYPVHLVRDVRGVALSAHEVYGWSVEFAAYHWMRVQEQIVRIIQASTGTSVESASYQQIVVNYEELCDSPTSQLNRITDRVGLDAAQAVDDFKSIEHHVLGNEMRFGSGRIEKSQRWRRDLSAEERQGIEAQCRSYTARSRHGDELSALLTTMFGT